MANLKTEQIMSSILTKVTGLSVTGSEVERDRDYPTDKDNSLSVEQGAEELAERTNAFIDNFLTVSIVAYVKKTTAYSTQLNQIRKEVYIAMMADRTQGLSFVFDTIPSGIGAVEVVNTMDKPAARMAIEFTIHYRHSLTDASL